MGSKKHGFFSVRGHRPRPLLGQDFNMAKGVFKRLLSLWIYTQRVLWWEPHFYPLACFELCDTHIQRKRERERETHTHVHTLAHTSNTHTHTHTHKHTHTHARTHTRTHTHTTCTFLRATLWPVGVCWALCTCTTKCPQWLNGSGLRPVKETCETVHSISKVTCQKVTWFDEPYKTACFWGVNKTSKDWNVYDLGLCKFVEYFHVFPTSYDQLFRIVPSGKIGTRRREHRVNWFPWSVYWFPICDKRV